MNTAVNAVRKAALTTWEGIWYVLMNIAFGAAYFAKVPAKKAMQDFGLVQMTTWEQFWYVLQCVAFGAGYFAKIPTAKALSELPQYQVHRADSLGTLQQQPQVPNSRLAAPPPNVAIPPVAAEQSQQPSAQS